MTADLKSLNLKHFIIDTTNDIFDTMLSMEVETVNEPLDISRENSRMVGSVGFAGDVIGCSNIHIEDTFARLIAAAMMGEDCNELPIEDLQDMVGELGNMIGGGIKSRLCDAGLPCSLSIPTATCGSDFIFETHGWSVHETIAFRSNEHVAFVEVYVKPNHSI